MSNMYSAVFGVDPDAEFDSTYARVFFDVPEEHVEAVEAALPAEAVPVDTDRRWFVAIEGLGA